MKKAEFDGVQLEYEVKGTGEPVLLISPVVAGAFVPFLSAPVLVDRYHLIRYHRRGWCGSTSTGAAVSIGEHAADAAALLEHLGIVRAHVAGHSSGGAIAMQLAVDRPDLVHTLTLLEPSLFGVPSAPALFEKAGPFLAAFADGDHERAVTGFLSVVSGLDPATCKAVIEENVPGGTAQAVENADTFFGIELPSLSAWTFGPAEARGIAQPVLSVLGSQTEQLWVDVAGLLRAWFAQVEELVVPGLGHLLQMQRPDPVARGIAAFLSRHPLARAQLAGRSGAGAGGESRTVTAGV